MAVENEFRVSLELLACSAANASGQGGDLATAHFLSDNRIEAAQSGWVGTSAAALRTRMAAWSATSHTLLARVGDHALGLHNAAIEFAAAEQQNAESLRAVVDTANGAGPG